MTSAKILKSLLRDERGTSAIEMGLICALIVLAMMTALNSFANENDRSWTLVSEKVADAVQRSTGN